MPGRCIFIGACALHPSQSASSQTYAEYRGKLATYLRCTFLCKLKIAPTLKTKEFQVVPKRWIVERTFGWFQWDRRLMIDYERKSSTAEDGLYCLNRKREEAPAHYTSDRIQKVSLLFDLFYQDSL